MARRRHRTPRAPLPRELFLDEAADRARSCTPKDGYPSEEHARAAMLANGVSLSTYRCRYCELWHLTRRRE